MDSKMKKYIGFIVVSIVAMSHARSQSTINSIADVWSYALKNNPNNVIYQLNVEKAIKDKKTANSYFYPKINVVTSGQYNAQIPETPIPGEIFGKPGETIFAQFGQTFNYSRGVTLNKTFLDWQSRFHAKIAESNTILAKAEKDVFEQSLKEQTAQIYYAILATQAAIDLFQEDLTLADSTLLLTSNRFYQGLVDIIVLNNAKINRNNVRDRLEQNKQFLYEQQAKLKILLGFSQNERLILNEKIQVNTVQVEETIISNDLNLRLYKIQIEKSQYYAKQAMGRFLPKLDFVSYYGGLQYQEVFQVSMKSSDWLASRYIGMNLSMPLFTGFANRNQYQSAKISKTISQIIYDDEVRKSSLNDSIILNNYVAAKYLVQTAEENLKLADENVKLAFTKFSEGLMNLDNYLSVYGDYLAIENQYFNRLSECLINKAIIQSRNK
jgi:outer membrane protein